MLDSGTEDLLVAYPVIGRRKLDRLMEVAKQVRLTVALDSAEAADGLAAAAKSTGVDIGVLVEANVGLNRTGVDPGPALISLAQRVHDSDGLRLEGFNFYSGHVWLPDPDGPARWAELNRTVSAIRDDFDRAGLPRGIVSARHDPDTLPFARNRRHE